MKYYWYIIIILSLLANIYWGYYFYPHWFPHDVFIPNKDQVNNFCKDKGYTSGWLDVSCGENKVMCYYKFYLSDLSKYKCEDWK